MSASSTLYEIASELTETVMSQDRLAELGDVAIDDDSDVYYWAAIAHVVDVYGINGRRVVGQARVNLESNIASLRDRIKQVC